MKGRVIAHLVKSVKVEMNTKVETEVVRVGSKIIRTKAVATGVTPVIVQVKLVEEKEAEKENRDVRKESRKKRVINEKKRSRMIVLHQRMMNPIQMFEGVSFLEKKLKCILKSQKMI